jgi:hypothetical protein
MAGIIAFLFIVVYVWRGLDCYIISYLAILSGVIKMRQHGKYFLFVIMILLSEFAFAEPAFLSNDPKRPVDKISQDLGIEPQQFVACFDDVRPAGQGDRPTSERVHANKATLLPCLQKANPNITNEILDSVMDRYRPGGHERQMQR